MKKKELKFVIKPENKDFIDSVPILWSMFPNEILESIREFDSKIFLDSEGKLIEKTVIYLRPVKRFKKEYKKYTIPDLDIVVGFNEDDFYDLF